ncbi:chemotaxis protein CheA [Psychrobacter sp. ANT_H56B]|uniref:ATP-binding protein n=1 Tax=Psychrobacter sp. ANT_H56B TaxID=2597353 RepID=UPI0011F37A3C|nr:ATP-binding protein [Psychrobacter sp. ANT_H56B]KAA0923357.1 chemotaxis protein CheA [Psychrobacter sp. ANT_H56B]
MTVLNPSGNSRYRGLILSIAAFLALIGILLAFTFYTSSVLERNTTLVNISNKTANNAQSIIKDLFDLQSSIGEHINSPHQKRVRERLDYNTKEIDQLLVSMREGSEYTDVAGNVYQIPSIKTPTELAALEEAQQDWSILKPLITNYLKDASEIRVDSSDELALAYEQAKTSSLRMNDALEQLTNEVYEETARQASTIRLIQVLGVAAIFAYFLIFVFFFVRRLRDTDAEALAARRETQEIMETVNTGLFLLDKDLNIGQQHSRALNGIIGEDRLAGENFADVLRGRISDKDLRTTRQFIEQLYNPRVKEKLVDSLNPLHKVMLHNASGEESTTSRFLDFKFSRVYEDKDIARILVNVNDVSDAVYLEQRLEKERSQNDMQIEMLTTILNVNPKIINEFISNTKAHIDKMNNILKNPGSSQFELEGKLKAIYREMHSLKGEASALKLHSFTKIASDAEDKLDALQNQGKLSGNNFLPLAVHLDDLLSLSNTIETLGERINQAAPKANNNAKPVMPVKTAPQPSVVQAQVADVATTNINVDGGNEIDLSDESDDEHLSYYQDFAKDIAVRQGKKIQLNGHNLAYINIPERLKQPIKEISIQLLRNAVVHGIESPEVRQSAGKSAIGSIDLEMQRDSQNLIIALQDDGQGIDYEGIRHKLIADGRFMQEEASQMTHGDLLKTLFASGFSTKEHADEDGGRGVGLDVIKALVKEHNGKLNVNTELGKMTRFVITLPAA